jgi:hypothetical protein
LGLWNIWVPAALAAWAGAVEPGAPHASNHWAFQPLRRPPLPEVKDLAWVNSPIDSFILARLEKEGLKPAPEADRATLIRRLSFDLLGLPPTLAEVDEFVTDPRPDAYERWVDRLLASPHYGERWARHWLDQARYADSNGYTIDGSRSIWKYRDWVIQAYRRDLPFDRFTVEQIAGDMLPEATVDQTIATGFHRNTLKNEEGGTDPEQFRIEAVADRVSTTATVFLALTVGCARCHDHKYDPITQREYYQLFALFNNADEPDLQVPTDQEVKELPALETELADAEKRLAENEAAVATRQPSWEERLSGRLDVRWVSLDPIDVAPGGPGSGGVSVDLTRQGLSGVSAVRVEALSPAPASSLNELTMTLRLLGGASASEGERASAESAAALASATNGTAIFYPKAELLDVTALKPGAKLAIQLKLPPPREAVGRLRVSVTSSAREALELPDAVREALARPARERSQDEMKLIAAHYRSIDKDRIPLAARVADLKKRQAELKQSITTTLVMAERKEPRATYIHIRGDFLRPGARVEGGVPAVLPPLATGPSGKPNRLDLARWIVHPANPLTPRVTMNRLWQAYFGEGIVATENDFGAQGSPPTHPELLDWLATELVAQGWSLKAMHRLIATSSTYRQSSRARSELSISDPYNRLLGRQARLRLEAETIRDAALVTSGLFANEIGGPGVYPPQPQGVFRFTQTVKHWKVSQGPDRYRRGMYTYFWRSSPYPPLMTFDAPDGNVACTRRARSNTPLQALTLANDPAFFEMAQALAARLLREAPASDGARVRHAFRLCLAREPQERESRRLLEFLEKERRQFAGLPRDAEEAAPPGLAREISTVDGAAWTALARVLLNLDEYITRE